MAFLGYLIKVGSFEITGDNIINESSYKATRIIQDVDSYRDANGVLHRTTLEHQAMKVEINTRNGLTNETLAAFLEGIQGQFTDASQRKASVECFIPEINDYVTQEMYMPDPEITINHIDGDIIFYDSVRLAFIGY